MGSKQSVDFGVALEKASHCAGETIHGYVQVNVLTNDVKVPELSVSLVGNAVTHVRYKRTKDDSGKAEETAKETKKILRLNAKVNNIDKSRLVKGTHLQCPFAFAIPVNELELELIQTQMTQKPMLRAEVYARALRASQNRKEDSV